MSYRWLEHTSELELQISASSEEGVFALVVPAIGELVGGEGERDARTSATVAPAQELTCEVSAAAGDRAALLAAFIDELVYLIETDDLVPERAERLVLAGERVTATVRGHRGRPRHLIKGVTYNELTFAPAGEGFMATVVLDV